ncbi:SRPBCC family protein [Hyalangium versicolor]|uniref:SRPBCC family protein n=1 Tax=Hyalangium versicolor TaxID=2861190 RepID=UPI001CCBDE8E|nr:SRPBCC domain-containing protein [Hyalangium versicolor]
MTVKKEASGRRSIQVEVEVPGTPEQVWEAIATGPGVSSWFVPSEIDGREGGAVVSHFGPGMDSKATVTAWEPPRRFAAESKDLGPESPALATEWIVEARSGGTCVVRVVHSLFASSDDWDDQLNNVESGWPGFFRILRLYLTHFRGQRCSIMQVVGGASGPLPVAWEKLAGALGLTDASPGQKRSAPADAPPLAGSIERVDADEKVRALLLLVDSPAPGSALVAAQSMGGNVHIVLSFYLYGEQAPAAVARDEPRWRAWLEGRFRQAGGAPC